ncbi:hypothetical protein SAMN05192562_101669 [Kosakonia arachidis]|uniref:Uncharacterized protein n=2 Tax=Kosakonia arachidis TaxID=551989 RepID=A0A1I6YQ75_9ENTR|nr:hypothetical protein SAMN05192562_101669 [Kosakonia arachidis]
MAMLPKATFSHKSLWFLEGDGDRKADDENTTSGVLSAIQHRVSRLRADDLPVTYLLYPGLTHGAMFDASMNVVILHMSGESLLASY